MKIAIVKNNYQNSKNAVSKIQKLLSAKHKFVTSNPDLVIAVGGDGTFLTAVQKYWEKNKNTIFFAVHSGTLGFYSDYTCSEIEMFVESFEAKDYEIQKAEVLRMEVGSKKLFALNDVRIESAHKTLIVDVYINNKKLESFRGNGLCFSTQTGSTAYNKSLGGAIMWPSTSGFQMTEVAPISNNAFSSLGSSIIFSTKDKVTLTADFDDVFASHDVKYDKIKGKKTIHIFLDKDKVKIVRFKKHYDFYKRLQDGFIK